MDINYFVLMPDNLQQLVKRVWALTLALAA